MSRTRQSAALRAVVVLHGQGRQATEGARSSNACDRAALQAVLDLRAQVGDVHITALLLGSDTDSQPVLRAALASGCDHGVHISMHMVPPADDDEELADTVDSGSHQAFDDTLVSPLDDTMRGSNEDTMVNKRGIAGLDYLGRAELVRAAVSRLGFDVLVCGACARSDHRGVHGPAVAELMSLPHVTNVVAIRASQKERTIAIDQRDGDTVHRFECQWPIVLGISVHGIRLTDVQPADAASTNSDELTIQHFEADELPVDSRILARQLAGDNTVTQASQMGVQSSAAELISRLFEGRLLQ